MTHAACGGVTLLGLSAEEDGPMTIAWGQNAAHGDCLQSSTQHSWLIEARTGELGFGADQPKSAPRPQQVQPLAGIDVFECAPVSFVRTH
jgi:hypothetical protein